MEITSTKNQMVLYACSLKEKKYRDKENKFLIEGEHLIEMANNIETIFTTNKNYKNDKVDVYYVTEAILEKISFNKAPQGIIAIVRKKENKIDFTKKRYLLCDKVADPGNLGTIIRTCLAFNVDEIILQEGSVDIYNDKVIRSSQGAIFKVNINYANLVNVISKLKENKVTILASTLSNKSIDLHDMKPVNKFALIVGNEGQGVSKEVIDASDISIKIKHSSNIDSLNVGVATSIMLYYLDALK